MTKNKFPQGYVAHRLGTGRVLVPAEVSKFLDAEEANKKHTRKLQEAREAEEQARILQSVINEPAASEPSPAPPCDATQKYREIYSHAEVSALNARAGRYKDGDEKARLSRIAVQLMGMGPRRPYQMPQAEAINAMAAEFPHFAEPIALVHQRVVLAQKTSTDLQVPPILVHGGPGTGKSHFARELAKVMGGPIRTVHFDTGAENSALLGLDKQWGNASPGILFDLLCLGPVANPVIVLEELDKTHRFTNGGCPLDSLHALLEPSTAVAVRDMCLEFQFDAGAVIYIATGNELSKVPLPLQSRFEVFEVSQPTAEQSIQIAMAVASAAVKEHAPENFSAVARSVAVAVAHLTARGVRKAVTAAIAAAVLNERDFLKVSDLRLDGEAEGSTQTWLH